MHDGLVHAAYWGWDEGVGVAGGEEGREGWRVWGRQDRTWRRSLFEMMRCVGPADPAV